jgi:hypothetical protein
MPDFGIRQRTVIVKHVTSYNNLHVITITDSNGEKWSVSPRTKFSIRGVIRPYNDIISFFTNHHRVKASISIYDVNVSSGEGTLLQACNIKLSKRKRRRRRLKLSSSNFQITQLNHI